MGKKRNTKNGYSVTELRKSPYANGTEPTNPEYALENAHRALMDAYVGRFEGKRVINPNPKKNLSKYQNTKYPPELIVSFRSAIKAKEDLNAPITRKAIGELHGMPQAYASTLANYRYRANCVPDYELVEKWKDEFRRGMIDAAAERKVKKVKYKDRLDRGLAHKEGRLNWHDLWAMFHKCFKKNPESGLDAMVCVQTLMQSNMLTYEQGNMAVQLVIENMFMFDELRPENDPNYQSIYHPETTTTEGSANG